MFWLGRNTLTPQRGELQARGRHVQKLFFPLGSRANLCKILAMNRRTFIESSLASVAVTSLPLRGLAAAHQLDSVGVELYTVRALMKTDVPGTLAKVAAIGYKEVEFAGYFDYAPKDLRAILDKNGLTAPACHVSYAVVQNKWPETIEEIGR